MLFERLDWCRWRSRRSIKSKKTLCLDKDQITDSSANVRGNFSKEKEKYTGPVFRVS